MNLDLEAPRTATTKKMRLFSLGLALLGACTSADKPTDACDPRDAEGRAVSSADPFARHKVSVGDDPQEFISYIDEGAGDPVIFLHGAPTSSYLWRNIIPDVARTHRAIAIDLVGYGDSGTPAASEFRYVDHVRWVTRFVEALGLQNVTFVVHDIGSIPGFAYAASHPDNVHALVHLESLYFPIPDENLLPPEARFIRSADGQRAIAEDNWFIETMMPGFIERTWCAEERAHYDRPWRDPARRRVLQRVPLDLPIGGTPADSQQIFERFGAYLMTSDVPKLLIYAEPGVLVQDTAPPGFPASIRQIVSGFPNTTTVSVGHALHFLQEDHPREVAAAIVAFLASHP